MPKTESPWDHARGLTVIRGNQFDDPAPLDSPVNFFVLMLEQLGCRPEWSCGGHPAGFHVIFYGPERIARAIEAIGFFDVALFRGGYNMSLCGRETRAAGWTKKERNSTLRAASAYWEKFFGPLGAPTPEILTVAVRDQLAAALRRLVVAATVSQSDDEAEREFSDIDDSLVAAEIALSVYADKFIPADPLPPESPPLLAS